MKGKNLTQKGKLVLNFRKILNAPSLRQIISNDATQVKHIEENLMVENLIVFLANKEFMKEAIRLQILSLEDADNTLKIDKKFVEEIMMIDGMQLNAVPNFHNDKQIVLAALNQNIKSYICIEPDLRTEDLILETLKPLFGALLIKQLSFSIILNPKILDKLLEHSLWYQQHVLDEIQIHGFPCNKNAANSAVEILKKLNNNTLPEGITEAPFSSVLNNSLVEQKAEIEKINNTALTLVNKRYVEYKTLLSKSLGHLIFKATIEKEPPFIDTIIKCKPDQ